VRGRCRVGRLNLDGDGQDDLAGHKMGEDFDATGHLSRPIFDEVGIPRDAEVYLSASAQGRRQRRSGGPSRPTATGLWLQVEDQRGAYQTEPEARRDERNQHSGREAGKDNE
jgi:hypothetical protein